MERIPVILIVMDDSVIRVDWPVLHLCEHKRGEGIGKLVRVLKTHADRQTALRVCIYQQNLFALPCKPNAQIHGGCGFSDASFLVDDCGDLCVQGTQKYTICRWRAMRNRRRRLLAHCKGTSSPFTIPAVLESVYTNQENGVCIYRSQNAKIHREIIR